MNHATRRSRRACFYCWSFLRSSGAAPVSRSKSCASVPDRINVSVKESSSIVKLKTYCRATEVEMVLPGKHVIACFQLCSRMDRLVAPRAIQHRSSFQWLEIFMLSGNLMCLLKNSALPPFPGSYNADSSSYTVRCCSLWMGRICSRGRGSTPDCLYLAAYFTRMRATGREDREKGGVPAHTADFGKTNTKHDGLPSAVRTRQSISAPSTA